jgi:hypothetical protein
MEEKELGIKFFNFLSKSSAVGKTPWFFISLSKKKMILINLDPADDDNEPENFSGKLNNKSNGGFDVVQIKPWGLA